MVVEVRSHRVIVTDNGQKCLELYHDKLQNIRYLTHASAIVQPFDIVILDYKMPQINGLNVAKEKFGSKSSSTYTICFSLYQQYCRRVLRYTTTVKARDDRNIAKTSKLRGSNRHN
jgi:hypothetical protein